MTAVTIPAGWPAVGDEVVVWIEVPPSRQPREPRRATVAHVGQRTFHVDGLDASFNRSTGRAKTVRTGGEMSARGYVAVPADSDRGREVLVEQSHRTQLEVAVRAAQAWMANHSESNRGALARALEDLRPDEA